MGILIRINDAEFSEYVGVVNIPSDGLRNLYYIGGTEAKSVIDYSGNKNTATAEGSSITYSNSYATFSDSGIENRLTAQNTNGSASAVTCLALVKKVSGTRAIVSNIGSSSSTAKGFSFATGRVTIKDSEWNQQGFTLPNTDNFIPMAFVATQSGYNVYYHSLSSGVINTLSKTLSVFANSTNPLCIGGDYRNWTQSGTEDLALAAYYERALTEAELVDAFTFIRAFGERVGLEVF